MKINEKITRPLKKGTSGRFAKTIFYFLRTNAYSSSWAKVTGNLSLSGQPKFVSLLRKELIKMREI